MKVRLNKKNENVTITLNADELWTLRNMAFEAWNKFYKDGHYYIAAECEPFRDETQKAYDYLTRDWGK